MFTPPSAGIAGIVRVLRVANTRKPSAAFSRRWRDLRVLRVFIPTPNNVKNPMCVKKREEIYMMRIEPGLAGYPQYPQYPQREANRLKTPHLALRVFGGYLRVSRAANVKPTD